MDAERLLAIAGSVLIHLLLVGILSFTLWQEPEAPAVSPQTPIIQARAVDEETAMEPVRRREAEEQRQREEAERQRRAEEARKNAEAEKRRKLAAEKRRQAEEAERQRKKAEETKRRQAELKRKQEEAERKRLAEEQRKREEAERKRKEAEAEKQRLAAEERRQAEEERKRKEQEDLERRKAELQRKMELEAERLAEEARQLRHQQLNSLKQQYMRDIANKVTRNWLRPPGSHGTLCTVVINQIPGGEITGVRVIDCDGDAAFQQSVERAVRKSSPLPMPPDVELFSREIEFVFTP